MCEWVVVGAELTIDQDSQSDEVETNTGNAVKNFFERLPFQSFGDHGFAYSLSASSKFSFLRR